MEITHIEPFLHYWERVRGRTLRLVELVPESHLEWTYRAGKFTIGDLIRHLGTIERYMYGECALFRPSTYPGCGPELASGLENVKAFLHRMHEESVAIFAQLTPEDLQRKTITPGNTSITLWKWLRAMVEHEVHHRGQLYLYLNMLDIATPPLYGLTAEEVQARSTSP